MILRAITLVIIPSGYKPVEGLSLFLLLQVDGFLEQIPHLLHLAHNFLVAWHHVVNHAAVFVHRHMSTHVTERNWPTYIADASHLISLRN